MYTFRYATLQVETQAIHHYNTDEVRVKEIVFEGRVDKVTAKKA